MLIPEKTGLLMDTDGTIKVMDTDGTIKVVEESDECALQPSLVSFWR